MKNNRSLLAVAFVLLSLTVSAQWKAVPGKIQTEWAAQVNPSLPLPEYPRPMLTRQSWTNLNGLWKYAIVPKETGENIPAAFDGDILVPFAVESSLSGVGRTVGKDSVLWYSREIEVPSSMRKGKVLLHFGAVDWQCRVYINGTEAGSHEGGYDPFTIDITRLLKKGSRQSVAVYVWDPSNEGEQPTGKQVKRPHGIWYTSVTGIWQTVWLEGVPDTYITGTVQTPDVDKGELHISVSTEGLRQGDEIKVTAWDGSAQVASQNAADGQEMVLKIPDAKLWSPASPFLYDLKISVLRKGKVIDEAGSYFGMRSISIAKDAGGIQRMMLNGHFLFQYGPLDQGWWPDGLYTAPTDEALKFDVAQTKALGFNMIRKHIKVEPARWYYYCDKLGILVWQDMPAGDISGSVWDSRPGEISGDEPGKKRSAASEAIYRKEWKAIMTALHNYPSIVMWIPFNEAWGQFKTKEIVDWTKQYDPSRLVNPSSGGNYLYDSGELLDMHNYPEPQMPAPEVFGKDHVLILGEFGGLGLPVEGHTWVDKGNWGYQSFKNKEDLFSKYSEFINQLPKLITLGLSGAVYTQTTDVEVEVNGLFTYDRKVLKMPLDKMFRLHQQLYDATLVK